MKRSLTIFSGCVVLIFVASLCGCSSTGRGNVDTPAASTVSAH